MEEMRHIAFETVMRACGFGSLAIFCVMVGLSFEPRLSFQSGGLLMLFMVGVLAYKAREAATKPYRRTEMWMYVPIELRPPEAFAQLVISRLMRETYLTFAYWSAVLALFMLAMALLFAIIGF
jgi:hypothetical protein